MIELGSNALWLMRCSAARPWISTAERCASGCWMRSVRSRKLLPPMWGRISSMQSFPVLAAARESNLVQAAGERVLIVTVGVLLGAMSIDESRAAEVVFAVKSRRKSRL